ncbi:glycosyltransferase family 4 protein [Parafrankia discariae]|uniref:glycosyltransferase family 4 protein n=1 Tax=Parafrankia discariae TaxID=365528 RepID=UPI0003A638A8|nr:glycosyltransferase family 1 protein [Parafrankia discariae]
MAAVRRIGFNLLSVIPRMVGGAETAAVELLDELANQRPGDLEYVLFCLDGFPREHPDIVSRFDVRTLPVSGRARSLRVLAENSWLAAQARRSGIDLLHHLGNVLPPVPGVPGVVTVYDLQPFDLPGNFSRIKTAYLRAVAPGSARRARLVITPSEFARRSVIDRFGVDPARVRTVPLGAGAAGPGVPAAEAGRRYGLPGRWFAFNAVTAPHKNHATLLRAFAQVAEKEPEVSLVLTGGPAQTEDAVRGDIDRLGLAGRVVRTGRIPRADMIGILRGAVALTFPSRYEGFGLPVLEAMNLGTPVLAANATALPEVVGAGGRLLEPMDVDAWAQAMLELLGDDVARTRLIDAGRRRAAELSWATAAERTVEVYRDALYAARA